MFKEVIDRTIPIRKDAGPWPLDGRKYRAAGSTGGGVPVELRLRLPAVPWPWRTVGRGGAPAIGDILVATGRFGAGGKFPGY